MCEVATIVSPEIPREYYGTLAKAIELAASLAVYGVENPKPGDVDVPIVTAEEGSILGAPVLANLRIAGGDWPHRNWVKSTEHPGLLVRPAKDSWWPSRKLNPRGKAATRHSVAISDFFGDLLTASGALDIPEIQRYPAGNQLYPWVTPFIVSGWEPK